MLTESRRVAFVHQAWAGVRPLLWQHPRALQALPGARTIRDAPHAIIIRIPLTTTGGQSRVVYYKQYRPQGLRGWIKSFSAWTPGRRVFAGSQDLGHRGFSAPLVVAFGHRRAGLKKVEPFSMTEAVEPAYAAVDDLRAAYPPPLSREQRRAKRAELVMFGGLVRRLHDSGIAYSDLQTGNILIRRLPQGPEVVLLEHDWFPRSGPIRLAERVRNLVELNMAWGGHITLSHRLQVLKGYEPDAAKRRALARRVADATHRRLTTRLGLKAGVTFRVTAFHALAALRYNMYRPVRDYGWRGFAMKGFTDRPILAQFGAIGETIRSGAATVVKHRRGRVTAVMTLPEDRKIRSVYIKEDNTQGLRALLKAVVRPSRPRVTWQRTLQLRAAGVAVQQPVALLEYRRWGVTRRAVYVGEFDPDAVPLARLLAAGAPAASTAWEMVLPTLAKELRILHDRGYRHGDLKAGNILVERWPDGWQARFIDLEGVEVVTPDDEARAVDLGRLWLSLTPLVEPAGLHRLLAHYAASRPALDLAMLRHEVERRVTALQTRRFTNLAGLGEQLRTAGQDNGQGRPASRWLLIALDHPHRVLQMTPLAAALKRAYPSVRLDVLTGAGAAPLLTHNADLDLVLLLADDAPGGGLSMRQALDRIRDRRYEVVIDLSGSWRSALCCRAVAGARIGYRMNQTGSVLFRLLADYTETIKAEIRQRDGVDHSLLVAEGLGIEGIDRRPRYTVTDGERAEAVALLRRHGVEAGRVIVADLSSIHPSARWPVAMMAPGLAGLTKQHDLPAVLIGQAGARTAADELLAQSPTRPIDLVGRLPLRQRAAIVAQAGLVVSGDPVTIELAAAMNVPAIYLNGGVRSEVVTPVRSRQVTVRPYCQCQVDAVRRPDCLMGPTWCMRAVSPQQLCDAAGSLSDPVRAQGPVTMELS